MNNYYIVNDVDRPDSDHVTIETPMGLKYLAPRLKDWPIMQKLQDATPVEDFGFIIEEIDGWACFNQVDISRAKYYDGRNRPWQGLCSFKLEIPN